MEGEKERQRQQREEKESNEAEDDVRSDGEADDEEEDGNSEKALLVWQEGYDKDNLGLPIMHWEALNLHIAELEKQEEEKKAKAGGCLDPGRTPEDRGRRTENWEDGSDACNSHVLTLSTRLQTQMNLQLCFINNSESEEEDEEEKQKGSSSRTGSVHVLENTQNSAKPDAPKSRSLRSTLRRFRERLRADHRTAPAARRDLSVKRKHLDPCELQRFSVKDLKALCASLSQDIQDQSSELVSCLHIRDQLRTKQDAVLLEVQDLMSL